jgi:hypothetical protein
MLYYDPVQEAFEWEAGAPQCEGDANDSFST